MWLVSGRLEKVPPLDEDTRGDVAKSFMKMGAISRADLWVRWADAERIYARGGNGSRKLGKNFSIP